MDSSGNNTSNSIRSLTLVRPEFGNVQIKDECVVSNSGNVFDKRICVRPGNNTNIPKVYVDESKEKYIVNNYGHAGIGYTTLFGSVQMGFNHFVKKNVDKNEKIVVIGAGCVGLYTALLLNNNGYKNLEIIAEKTDDIPSYNCGAIYSAASMKGKLDEKMLKYATEIFVGTYTICQDILKGKHFLPRDCGLVELDGYYGDEKEVGTVYTNSGIDILVEHGLIPKPEVVYLNFGKKKHRMRKYRCVYFNPFKIMSVFHELLRDAGHSVKIGKVENLAEVDSKYIFNCSGLGSRVLRSDLDILPICGHVIHLKEVDLSKMTYYVYTNYIPEKDKDKHTTANPPLLYFMPKFDGKSITGILGGTLLRDYVGDNDKINEKEYYDLMDRALDFFDFKNPQGQPKF